MATPKHQAKKRFGQNFLHDQHVIQKILSAINAKPDETIIEIGPGLGALTFPLLKKLGKLTVVEIDRDVISHLTRQAAELGELTLHNTDALRFDFSKAIPTETKAKVVGNLPYNISTPLIFHLLETSNQIQDMYFMLQKEVVDRIAAAPGGKNYGRLSVMVQYYCRAEALFVVKPGAFNPAPKVDSAVVKLSPWETKPYISNDDKHLYTLVTQAFSKRRKTLRNTLKGLLTSEQIESAGIDPSLRPEVITVEQFVTLSNLPILENQKV